ncbi:MAG: hypothetical protein H0W39_01945 [Sphingomonas sp.]|nr:hypothetical protein [Sphingomonas sp.]
MKDEDFRQMTIKVTPKPGTGTGNEIECDISGTNVCDDAIFLPKTGNYEITFEIDPKVTADWKKADPFCARLKKCPRRGSPSHGLMQVKCVAADLQSFIVEARASPIPARQVFHYRLNFADGATCDPIIIRD